jgi:hypothetical protein
MPVQLTLRKLRLILAAVTALQCPNRAAERRKDMLAVLGNRGYTRVLDFTHEENSAAPAYFEVLCMLRFLSYCWQCAHNISICAVFVTSTIFVMCCRIMALPCLTEPYTCIGRVFCLSFTKGTGVLVNDRVNGVAYVALSERAHPRLAQQWVEEMG